MKRLICIEQLSFEWLVGEKKLRIIYFINWFFFMRAYSEEFAEKLGCERVKKTL